MLECDDREAECNLRVVFFISAVRPCPELELLSSVVAFADVLYDVGEVVRDRLAPEVADDASPAVAADEALPVLAAAGGGAAAAGAVRF